MKNLIILGLAGLSLYLYNQLDESKKKEMSDEAYQILQDLQNQTGQIIEGLK